MKVKTSNKLLVRCDHWRKCKECYGGHNKPHDPIANRMLDCTKTGRCYVAKNDAVRCIPVRKRKEVFVHVHRYYTVTHKPTGEALTKDRRVIVFSYAAMEWFMGASLNADGKRRKRSEFRPAPIYGDLPENSISAEQWVGCEPSKIPWDQEGGE